MMTFKEFIAEEAVESSDRPKFEVKSLQSAIEIAKKYCSDSAWMFESKSCFFRGMNGPISKYSVVDTSATQRKSENTSNHYTIILDSNPLMKGYPKRSRSFIAATSRSIASGFSDGGNRKVYSIIPFDNTKIGFTNQEDLWDTYVSLFGVDDTIERMNTRLKRIHELDSSKVDLQSFFDLDLHLKQGDKRTIDNVKSIFPDITEEELKDFLKALYRAYDPKKLGFDVFTPKTLDHSLGESEVWIGGNVLVIDFNVFSEFCEEWKANDHL